MSKIKAYDYILKPGYIFIPEEAAILGAVLGNGVVVTIFDSRKKKGGMCHFSKPKPLRKDRGTAVYGAIAIPALLNLFLENGSRNEDLKAHVIGGATSTERKRSIRFSSNDLGEENFLIARKVLEKYKIKRVAYSSGGYQGKKILFNTSTNELFAANINKVRTNDWVHR